jgi:hypothetical protein
MASAKARNTANRSDTQMNLPTDGKLLPWNEIPRWLQALRVAIYPVWAIAMASIIGLFVLQFSVSNSPTHQSGSYEYPLEFKGIAYFLTRSLYDAWMALQLVFLVSSIFGFTLMMLNRMFESRIKWRVFHDHLKTIEDRGQ